MLNFQFPLLKKPRSYHRGLPYVSLKKGARTRNTRGKLLPALALESSVTLTGRLRLLFALYSSPPRRFSRPPSGGSSPHPGMASLGKLRPSSAEACTSARDSRERTHTFFHPSDLVAFNTRADCSARSVPGERKVYEPPGAALARKS